MSANRKNSRLRRALLWGVVFGFAFLFLIMGAGFYLNQIGLPDFLKKPLLTKLQQQGVEVTFSRMRLRWYRGIVMDEATFTLSKEKLRPRFSAAETVLTPNYHSLFDSKLQLDSLRIKEGNLHWPLSPTNVLALSNLTARIQFKADHELEVTQLQGEFLGAQIEASGSITNPAALRTWKFPKAKKPAGKKKNLAALLEQIHLDEDSRLTLNFSGDAAVPTSFKGTLDFSTSRAQTPWGSGTNLQFAVQVRDLTTPENNFARLKITSADTPWGGAANLTALARLASALTNAAGFQTDLKISAKRLHSKMGAAGSAFFSGRSTQSLTNLIPSEAKGTVGLIDVKTKWGQAAAAELIFAAATNSRPKIGDQTWAAWKKAEPYNATWEARLTGVASPKLNLDKLFCAGSWLAPELNISRLDVELYDGAAHATGAVNVATREASAKTVSDFDAQKISRLLTPFGQRWIAKYSWEKPPKVEGQLQVTLPAWTNASPDWRKEVLPTLWLDGNVSVGKAAYREVTATSARTDFNYSNMVWTLPHLHVERPEGAAELNLIANDQTRAYQWRIQSQIDPAAIRHLLEAPQQRVLDDFQFTSPPTIRAELHGHWFEMEKTSGSGQIIAKDFSYRSNKIDSVKCDLLFTNQQLEVTAGRLESGGKFITADKVSLNVPRKRLYFTNVYGTVDPHLVAGLIGRKVAKHIAPYQFVEPPAIRLNGELTIGDVDDADMHFVVEGSQFHWSRFDADQIAGRIDWVGQSLLLTNIAARAYNGGRIMGWSEFDFAATNGANYHFDLAIADIDIRSVVEHFKGKTNQLEGLLHGQMTLESGNTSDPKSLRGHGQVNLRDGLIWDVPLFGVLSPMLNAILPGSGNSRAREASAKFTVKDGIIYSDNLEVRSPTMRLQYRGGVDFEQNLDARVEADLLRDTWLVGRFVSLALTPLSKMFEYRVTGTLSKPESEPVYIPNFLMMTLRPFHTIKKALEPGKPAASGVSPAISKP